MKVLFVSSGFPYPVDAGRKVVLSGFLDYAVTAVGADNVALLCISSGPDEEDLIGLAPCRTFFVPLAPAVVRAAGVVWNSLVLRRRPIQETTLAAPAAKEVLRALLREMKPDVVVLDTIRVAGLVGAEERQAARCILYLDDLYSLRYRRTLEAMAKFPDAAIAALGTFGRFLPGPARRLVDNRSIQTFLLRLESILVAKREAQTPAAFDEVLLLNSAEAARLRELTGATNVHVVPPLIRRGSRQLKRAFRGQPTFLFLGNLCYPANSYSLSLFLRRAMPALVEQAPDVRLMVVGRGKDTELVDLARSFNGSVEFLDFVEDLEALANSAAGMVVPLVFGTGLKIKVIEAFARGLPVVSTSCGTDGLEVRDGIECLIENDLAAFPRAMVQLLDPTVNERLSAAGATFYATHLAPNVVHAKYRGLFLQPQPQAEFVREAGAVAASVLQPAP